MSLSQLGHRIPVGRTLVASIVALCLVAVFSVAAAMTRIAPAMLPAEEVPNEGTEDGLSPQASEDRRAEEEAKLALITEKLAGLRTELGTLDERQTTVIGELHRLDVEIGVSHQTLELLKVQLEREYREIDENLKQIEALEESIRELRPYLATRAVSLYKLGKLSYMRLLLSVEKPSELTRAYRYISRLAKADGEKFTRFLADQDALERRKIELTARTTKNLETRQELEQTTETLEKRRAARTSLLEQIHERRETAETLVDELEQARTQLGKLISDWEMGRTSEVPPTFLPIRLFHGELGWPVDGPVATRFGMQHHPRFRTVTVQNGIEIQAPVGTAVQAIYDGEAVFASWFQGYGTLLILSHPHGVYSLYGHLSEIKVREGDTVRRGEEVALVGDTGSLAGPALYLEIREEGKPVDPEQWLAPQPTRATVLLGERYP
ncbi:MAG TPA: peptidoglycan DD-metalloendopeptidase family protein [Vicinamibacteria bacterium]